MNAIETAETAILALQEGIDQRDSEKILSAYRLIENSAFDWDDAPDCFDEWDKLTEEGNAILYNE